MILPLIIIAAIAAPPLPVPPECRGAEANWIDSVVMLARDPSQESYRLHLTFTRSVLETCIANNQQDA